MSGAPAPAPDPNKTKDDKPKAKGLNSGTFVLVLFLAVLIGVLVYAGGSAWSTAANKALADSKLSRHAQYWIYAAVLTVTIVLLGFIIALVIKQLNISIPLDITAIITGGLNSGTPPLLGATQGSTQQPTRPPDFAPIRFTLDLPVQIGTQS